MSSISSTINQQDDHDNGEFETPHEDFHSPNIHEISEVVEDIHSHDILFGRGNGVNNRDGNIFFRKLVSQRKRDYRNGHTPQQRKAFAYQIYDEIKKLDPPGRFLMRTSYDKIKWYNVNEEKALRKICQALRERLVNDPPDIQSMKKSGSMFKEAVNAAATSVCPSLTSESRSRDSEASKSLPANYSTSKPLMNPSNLNELKSGISDGINEIPDIAGCSHLNLNLPLHLFQRYQCKSDSNINQIVNHQMVNADSSTSKILNKVKDLSEPKDFAGCQQDTQNNPSHSQKASSYDRYDDKILENKSCSSSNAGSLNILSTVVLNDHLLRSKMPEIKNEITLPKIKVDENVLSQEQDEVINYDSKISPKPKRKAKIISAEGPKKKKASVDISAKESKRGKENDHQQVILPLSYIGKSFLSSSDCSDESKFIFEELSDIGNHKNDDGFLYLPSIIGSLCKRITELERDEN